MSWSKHSDTCSTLLKLQTQVYLATISQPRGRSSAYADVALACELACKLLLEISLYV